MDASMFRDAEKGLLTIFVIVFLVGGACGAGCLYLSGKAGGYRIHIEKVEKN
jgi:hypothetical protein